MEGQAVGVPTAHRPKLLGLLLDLVCELGARDAGQPRQREQEGTLERLKARLRLRHFYHAGVSAVPFCH
jgi:uncharacterized protein involved in propanediol utilization